MLHVYCVRSIQIYVLSETAITITFIPMVDYVRCLWIVDRFIHSICLLFCFAYFFVYLDIGFCACSVLYDVECVRCSGFDLSFALLIRNDSFRFGIGFMVYFVLFIHTWFKNAFWFFGLKIYFWIIQYPCLKESRTWTLKI